MAELSLPAPAKLNLFLHVTGRREDGYHELRTAYRLLEFGDTVHLAGDNGGRLSLRAPTPGVAPEADLTLRAARALQAGTGTTAGAVIAVDKRIPAGAGLGGGSSNAAAVLKGLNTLWGLGLDQHQLAAIGLSLGADVPVFVHGRDAWAEGVGEVLTPLSLPPAWYVVLLPPVHCSTAELFSAPELRRDRPALAPRQWLRDPAGAGNDFEPVVRARHPLIDALWHDAGRFGRVRLSGSGSACFLEFDCRESAEEVCIALGNRYNMLMTRAAEAVPGRNDHG